MLARETLVAEVFADFKNLVNAADEEAFVIQLNGDAEVEIAVQRVVMRDEWRSGRTAGNVLHHGSLDFHITARMEKIADLANNGAAEQEGALDFIVGHQVEIALPIANLGVHQAMPFFGRRAERLGKNNKRGHLDGDFAGLGGEHGAVHADEIAEVEVFEDVELVVAERLFLRVNLDAAALVFDVDEDAFAHLAVGGDAAGEGDFAVLDVIGAGVVAGFGGGKFIGKRVNATGAERGELGLALINQ